MMSFEKYKHGEGIRNKVSDSCTSPLLYLEKAPFFRTKNFYYIYVYLCVCVCERERERERKRETVAYHIFRPKWAIFRYYIHV